MPITTFAMIQNDSGKRPLAACWHSDRIRTSAVRNGVSQCFASVVAPSRQWSAHAPTLLLRARPRLLPNAQQLGGEVSSCLFPEMPSNEPDLFALDVRGFEDRPPLLNLSLVVGGERLRILILARRNLLAEIGE